MEGLFYIIGMTLLWGVIALSVIHVFYLFFGMNHRRERLVSQRSLDQLSKRSMLGFVEQQDLRVPDAHKPMVDLFINQNLSLPFKDNTVDIMTDGYAFLPELLHDIASATHHVHIDMYIIEDDAFGNLVADARRSFFERMREEGVEIHSFLPVHFPTFTSKVNYRNHRKLIVIDGRVGYVGGMNIAKRYVSTTWRDTMLRVTGGVVYSLQRAFLVDWYFVDRTLITNRVYYPQLSNQNAQLPNNNCLAQLVTSGPTTPYPEIMQGYVRAITAARRYIYIETPYFLPNEPVLFALKTAASRSYLRELREAGARVCLYEPAFLHSKLMVIDDALSICGSTNLDFRSFENNFESNIFIYDEGTALRLKKVFLDDLSQSISLDDVPSWMHPKFVQRLWESFTRLLSPLL